MDELQSCLTEALGDRYHVERELGRGGMAIVYLAQDLKHGRPVAIKVLRPELGVVPALGADRFLREIEIAARLAHPNILPLYDSGEAGGLLYYVMPYVQGETLRERLNRERQLHVTDAVALTQGIADALGYAHSMGSIHRDIKPENILFQAGHALVSDFGIARALSRVAGDGGRHMTESGVAIGTLAYMSPEQALGQKDVDGRADIYSLGCVLYEMLSGETPLGPTMSMNGSEGLTAGLRRARDNVPAPLARVIRRALARDPADRFASAGEFVDALQAALKSGGGRALTIPTPRTLRGWIGVAAACALVATAGIFAAPRVRSRLLTAGGKPAAVVKLAVLPFANLTGDSTQEYFSDGITEEMITQLGRLAPGRLGIIARTSAMHYKDTREPLDRIGRELAVEFALEGSVRRDGARVRITAQLVRVRDQMQLWTNTYDRTLDDILAVQSAVAQGVAKSLALTLVPGEQLGSTRARTVDPEAYEAYLRGRERNAKLTRTDLETAIQYHQLALRKDSTFALAYLGIVHAWGGLQQMGFVSPREAQSHMREALARALSLDSTSADARYRRAGLAVWSDWDWKTGEEEFERAVALNPNDPEGQAGYAHFLSIMKRPAEAMQHMQRALALDPFSPVVRAFYGVLLNQQRRFAEALEQFRQVQVAVPNMPMALNQIPNTLHQLGRDDEALAAERAAWAARNDSVLVSALDQSAAVGGYQAAMHRIADVLAARAHASGAGSLRVFEYYRKSGDVDHAVEWLERAYRAHDPNLPYLNVAPLDARLRADPRFVEIMRRLKLPS
ncbi:MAG TPA: protein kinase [Gemmatimonadaceae bacterium]|nr:protein kinase [Gemmatimonadaceae bacterium]